MGALACWRKSQEWTSSRGGGDAETQGSKSLETSLEIQRLLLTAAMPLPPLCHSVYTMIRCTQKHCEVFVKTVAADVQRWEQTKYTEEARGTVRRQGCG